MEFLGLVGGPIRISDIYSNNYLVVVDGITVEYEVTYDSLEEAIADAAMVEEMCGCYTELTEDEELYGDEQE